MKKLVTVIDYYDEQSDKFFKDLLAHYDRDITVIVDPGSDEERKFIIPGMDKLEYKIEDGAHKSMHQVDIYMDEIPTDYQQLVEYIQKTCNCGHSFSINLITDTGAFGEYFFDGDGATRVYANGKSNLVNFSR